jgi:hypothetical protein
VTDPRPQAYRETRARLERILWEEDPEGIGSSISAPLDEYSSEAGAALPLLSRAADEAAVRAVLDEVFEDPGEELVRRVTELWADMAASGLR